MEVLSTDNPQATIRDSFLDLAELICSQERLALQELGRDTCRWEPADDSIFKVPICLRIVVFEPKRPTNDFAVTLATFNVMGDDEAGITVSRQQDEAYYEEPFAELLLGQFHESYMSHRHSFCVGVLRSMRSRQVARSKLMRDQLRRNFTITDNRGPRP